MKKTSDKSDLIIEKTVVTASRVRIMDDFTGLSCKDVWSLIAERRKAADYDISAIRLAQMKRIEEESRFLSKMTELGPKQMMMHFDI